MEGSSNGSFIPKRGPSSKPKRAVAKQVYVFTIFSYVFFFATLAAAAGTFIYDRVIDSQLEAEVAALDSEIKRFNEADLNRVKEFDLRLEKAHDRLNHSVTFGPIFTALEQAAANTVRIESLEIIRQYDNHFELIATLITDTFDSSLFQRELYEQNGTIDTVDVVELAVVGGEEEGSGNQIELSTRLTIPLTSVPYVASAVQAFTQPVEEVIVPVEDDEVDSSVDDSDLLDTDADIDNQTAL